MRYNKLIVAVIAPALLIGACNKRGETPEPAVRNEAERNNEISRLDQRVAEIEREYAEANQEVAKENKTPTAGLREELKEDVSNVKQAVNDLRTTTPENWWNRHEEAMTRTAADIEADVARLAGQVKSKVPSTTRDADGEAVSTEPFTSQRDKFVADMRAQADAMKRALDNVKAEGAQQTELEDVRARVNKLSDDIDRLKSASPDDWWDVSKARVTEYVDRVEGSVNRLDDRG